MTEKTDGDPANDEIMIWSFILVLVLVLFGRLNFMSFILVLDDSVSDEMAYSMQKILMVMITPMLTRNHNLRRFCFSCASINVCPTSQSPSSLQVSCSLHAFSSFLSASS
jgi:hypothetical protein